jgi:hypothetical protein
MTAEDGLWPQERAALEITLASLLRSLGCPKALSVAGGFQAWKKLQAPPPA